MGDNIVHLPANAPAGSARPPHPEEYPEWCYSWVEITPTRSGHWRVNRYAALRYEADVARAADALVTRRARPLPEVPMRAPPRESTPVDPEQRLDDACRAFFRACRRLATPEEKEFFLAKGRWPLCWAEVDQWRQMNAGPEEIILQLAVGGFVAIGSLAMVWLGG